MIFNEVKSVFVDSEHTVLKFLEQTLLQLFLLCPHFIRVVMGKKREVQHILSVRFIHHYTHTHNGQNIKQYLFAQKDWNKLSIFYILSYDFLHSFAHYYLSILIIKLISKINILNIFQHIFF